MSFENLINLDPQLWPIAVMSLLRIMSIFFFLPIFSDTAVPSRLRISLGVGLTLCLWPVISEHTTVKGGLLSWSPGALMLVTFREVFFGFCVGFSAKLVIVGSQIAAQITGINMGFQAATLFSPAADHQESAFASFKGWFVIVLILTLNIHHVFLEGIANSFSTVPIGADANHSAVLQIALGSIQSSFLLGLRLAAPLLLIQILSTLGLGLLNRAIPQVNVFVINFPVGFALGMGLLVVSFSLYARTIGGEGMEKEIQYFQSMKRAFHSVPEPRK